MTSRDSERGLALVVVLWGIAALSLIAAAMLAASLGSARIGHNAWAQVQVQTAADAGVQGAILSLFNPGPDGRPRLDGGESAMRFGDTTVSVSIQDESGRIDINYASRGLLRDYFRAVGAAADEADRLAGRVVDWRSPKGAANFTAASAADYERAGYSYRPRGAPFQSVDELQLVLGMTPGLFERAAPGLTVYSHHANFDTRTAPKKVLEVIPGIDESRADQTIATRPPAIALPGHAFTIVATATSGPTRFSRRAVVLLSGDPAHPFWILDWR